MSDPLNTTGAASLGVYLTGASAAFLTQSGPLLSLGGFPSNVAVMSLTPVRPAAMPGIWIQDVAGANGLGVGVLAAVSLTQLTWTAPGDTEGAPVAIAEGETRALFSGTTSKYIVVSRAAGVPMSGSEFVQLADTYNNWLGGSNWNSGEATAGGEKFLALMFVNRAASGDITNLKVWIDTTQEGLLEIAKEVPVSGAIAVQVDEDEEIGGLTWVAPASEGAALSIGTLTPAARYGLRRKRYVEALTVCNPHVLGRILYSWTYGGENYFGELRGCNRTPNLSAIQYEYYVEDHDPDPATDTPVATSPTLPIEYAANYTEGVYYRALYLVNEYGLRSPVAESQILAIDADGAITLLPPDAPLTTTGKTAADGAVEFTSLYHPIGESATTAGIRELRANKWLIWYTADGTDPDPETDTPVILDMQCTDPATANEADLRQREMLRYLTATEVDGAPVRALIRTRRDNGVDDPVDSTNTNIVEVTANRIGPLRPRGYITFDGARGQSQGPAGETGIWYGDAAHHVRIEYAPGSASLYGDSELVLRCLWDSGLAGFSTIYLNSAWGLNNETISGAGIGEVFEVPDWDADGVAFICVNAIRRASLDFLNRTFSCDSLTGPAALGNLQSTVPAFPRYTETIFTVFDPATETYGTYLKLDTAGLLTNGVQWDQSLDQAAIEAL